MDTFLNIFLSYVLPFIGIAAIIAAIVFYTVWLNKRVDGGNDDSREAKRERKGIKPSPFGQFLGQRQQDFADTLIKALPSSYRVVPNPAIELLFNSGQRADLKLAGNYVDFGVFTENWLPVLVIILQDYSPTGKPVFDVSEEIRSLIHSIGIKTMEYSISDFYSIDELRKCIAKTMNPLYDEK